MSYPDGIVIVRYSRRAVLAAHVEDPARRSAHDRAPAPLFAESVHDGHAVAGMNYRSKQRQPISRNSSSGRGLSRNLMAVSVVTSASLGGFVCSVVCAHGDNIIRLWSSVKFFLPERLPEKAPDCQRELYPPLLPCTQ